MKQTRLLKNGLFTTYTTLCSYSGYFLMLEIFPENRWGCRLYGYCQPVHETVPCRHVVFSEDVVLIRFWHSRLVFVRFPSPAGICSVWCACIFRRQNGVGSVVLESVCLLFEQFTDPPRKCAVSGKGSRSSLNNINADRETELNGTVSLMDRRPFESRLKNSFIIGDRNQDLQSYKR